MASGECPSRPLRRAEPVGSSSQESQLGARTSPVPFGPILAEQGGEAREKYIYFFHFFFFQGKICQVGHGSGRQAGRVTVAQIGGDREGTSLQPWPPLWASWGGGKCGKNVSPGRVLKRKKMDFLAKNKVLIQVVLKMKTNSNLSRTGSPLSSVWPRERERALKCAQREN